MSTQQPPLSLHRLTFVSPLNQDLVADFLAHLRTRYASPKTLQTTLGALVSFYRLLPPARQPRLWQEVTRLTPADIDAWLQAAQRKGLAPSTLHTLLGVVRRCCTFLQEQGLLAHHPIHPRRHAVLLPQMLPRPMAEDDLIRFSQVIDALRDRTMFLLMLRCGLRVGEVTTLPWSAINWTQGTIRVDKSKGRVDRVVYISPDLEKVLRQWRRAQWPPMPWLFPSSSTPAAPVRVRSIQRVMARYLKAAGITKACSPHTLRHTFATQLLNAGTALEVVKELMGHRSITLTLRYAQVYDTTKRTQDTQAMAQIEPRQALSGGETMDDTIRQAIDGFRAYLERRHYAAHTLASYTLDLQRFFAACPQPLAQVSFRDVEQFMDRQYHQGLAPTTLHRRLHALKHFFDSLIEQRRVIGNPVKPSHMVRRGRPLPKALSQDQVQRLCAQIHHPMDKALFWLMLRCGLRVSEVVHLQMEHIDWTQQALQIVQGKGRKDRRVSISPEAVTSLQACLTLRPAHAMGTYVFWNQKRPHWPLSITAVQKKMERYAQAAGIKASCHWLRHTFASN